MPGAVYVHGAGTDSPILRLTGTTNTSAATQAAYLQDGLGSVVGIVTLTGSLSANQRFDAWGQRTAGSGSVPQYGYTGREPDATGLTYYRARYYHAGIGRFMSRDPAGMVDAVSPYAYVGNNPVNRVGPFGLQAQLVTPGSQSAYPSATASDWNQPACGVGSSCAQLVLPNPVPAAIAGTPGRQAMPSQTVADSIFTTPDTRDSITGQIEGKPSSVSDPFKNLPLTTPAGIGLRVIDLILNQEAAKKVGTVPDFVVAPNGTAFPVPEGAHGPVPVVNPAGRKTGVAYTGGNGGANKKVDTIRIMDPTPARGASPGYPNGYIKYENASGQGVNPITGKTVPNTESHFPVQ